MITSPVVPTITREQLFEALRVLGIEFKGTRSVSIRRGYVEVEQLVLNEQGKRCAAGDTAATAVIQIPIVDNNWKTTAPVAAPDGGEMLVDAGVA